MNGEGSVEVAVRSHDGALKDTGVTMTLEQARAALNKMGEVKVDKITSGPAFQAAFGELPTVLVPLIPQLLTHEDVSLPTNFFDFDFTPSWREGTEDIRMTVDYSNGGVDGGINDLGRVTPAKFAIHAKNPAKHMEFSFDAQFRPFNNQPGFTPEASIAAFPLALSVKYGQGSNGWDEEALLTADSFSTMSPDQYKTLAKGVQNVARILSSRDKALSNPHRALPSSESGSESVATRVKNWATRVAPRLGIGSKPNS